MELNEVELSIRKVHGVLNMHDLHMWTISSGLIVCSCHIIVAEQSVSGSQKILKAAAHMLGHDFKISHSTIQIKVEDCGGYDHTTLTDGEHEHKHAH